MNPDYTSSTPMFTYLFLVGNEKYVKHLSEKGAEDYANRYARENPGVTIHMYKGIATFKMPFPDITRIAM